MTHPPPCIPQDAQQAQAEDWFARLRAPDCPESERVACLQWRRADPQNEAAYRDVQRIWERSALLRLSPEIAQATAMAMARRASDLRLKKRQRLLAVAAATVMAVGLGLLLPWTMRGDAYGTGTGEQRSITLADGSKVLLDAESKLVVHYSEQERRLVLDKGQAQFKVERDAQRPFVVQAANGMVRALGTEFQVRVMGRDVVVTLLEGKVAVDVPGPSKLRATETLVAGQQIAYNVRKEIGKKREADLEVAKGWTYGDLVFKRWRLDDLVAEMNRYSPTKLVIQDALLGELVVSGRFHAGDHQSLILALENDWPVRADPISSTQVALYRR